MKESPAPEVEVHQVTHGEDLPDDVMGMPRSRKGVKRKSEIVDAALRIIGRDGIQGVSMRAVAAEASVPLGTASYYFSDKDELIEAAFLRHTQRETARVVSAIANLGRDLTSTEVASRLADFVIQGLTEYREQLITEYQFLNESVRRENLRRASAAWLQSLTAHLEATVTALSSSSPKTDARLILAVLAGIEVDNLGARPGPPDRRAIRAMLDRLLQGLSELWLHERR
jgi:DNA-binding transcriptional regulator YbjK